MHGYIYALLSSIFFGLYVIPRKLTKLNSFVYTFFMAISYFACSSVIYLIHYFTSNDIESLRNPILLYSVLASIIWGCAIIFLNIAITKIGLTKSNQWKNLQGPIGVILCLFVLSEYMKTNVIFAILAGIAVFISAIFLNIRKNEDKKINTSGIIFSVMAALFFGVLTMINKFLTDNGAIFSQQLVLSFSLSIILGIYILISQNLKKDVAEIKGTDINLGLLGGFLYYWAGLLSLISYKYIPAAIGFTIIQLNALWVIVAGIFVFKEINFKENKLKIILGIVFAVIGILLLVFAKK